MAARNYSSVARATTLTAGVSGSSTLLPVSETTGFPSVPFTLVLDPGRAAEEAVTVIAQVGLNLTVVRGEDGTGAVPHDAGATVRHMATARDFREAADHIAQSSSIHGVVGSLLGQSDDQDVDNKTFTPLGTDHTPLHFKAGTGQTSLAVDFLAANEAVLGGITPTGRVITPGIDGTDSSTFSASLPSITPLVARSSSSQTANIVSVRNSANTELTFVAADGHIGAPNGIDASSVTASTVNATTSVTTPGLVSTTQSTFIPPNVSTVPLVINLPDAHAVSALAVRDDTNTSRSGIAGETGGFQLYHGTTTNKVPYKVHGGSVVVVMQNGASSWAGSADISGFGFDTAPLVTLTVRQENESSLKRRVAVTIEGAPTTSTINFRVHQTAGEIMPDDTTYRVHWIAWQFGIATAAG